MVQAQNASLPARRLLVGWLSACLFMVGLMVILGGLTRLTHSGLSMVEWQVLNPLPPLSETQWGDAFAKYQGSPEYRQVNSGMSLDEFKMIFWMEYVHRLWGRLIGLVFAVPLLLFFWRGHIGNRLALRLAAIFLLGGLQGLMGWLMVKSGLADLPDVSHYRLATHLILAFVIMAALLWTALDLAAAPMPKKQVGTTMRGWVFAFVGLVLTTACWGAFVAGLDAGLIYNSFPLMEGRLYPEEIFALTPLSENFVANPATVQFIHRLLALTSVLAASLLWLAGRKRGYGPLLSLLALWAWGQASLGVATLLLQVPVILGALHQLGAVVLFCLAVALLHRIKA
jgi:cytochrome c oxidase assembly protein subunit 15